MIRPWNPVHLAAGLAILWVVSAWPATAQEPDADALEAALRARIQEIAVESGSIPRRDSALEALPSAESLYRQRPDALSLELLIRLQLLAGRFDEAQHHAEMWVRWQPDRWQAQWYLGQALASKDEYESALAPLERAFERAPEAGRKSVGQSLVAVFKRLGRLEEALVINRQVGGETSAPRAVGALETLGCGDPEVAYPCHYIEALEEEARRLEEELKALNREEADQR